jgi:tetratricopeptide (TPR) repeat protein
MMLRSRILALCLASLLCSLLGTAVLAETEKVSQIELAAQKELLQYQIESVKALHQRDSEAINKRIDDQLTLVGQGVDKFASLTGWLGIVVTALLVIGGFVGYRNTKSDALSVAKSTAKEIATAIAREAAESYLTQSKFNEKSSKSLLQLQADNFYTLEQLLFRYNEACKLGESRQHQAAIEAYDAILDACRHDQDLKIQSIAARALVNKGAEQGKLKEFSNAAESFREALDFYAKDDSRQFDEPVAYALTGLAFTKHLKAQSIWSKDSKKAVNILESALDDLNIAIERYPNAGATVFGNKSQVLWLLSKHAQAEDEFRRALTLDNGGGKNLYESTIKDLDDSNLREFKSMRPMIDRLWQDFTANT